MRVIKEKVDLNEVAKVAIGGFLGYLFFVLTSHPNSKVHGKLPQKKIKNIQVFPNIKIARKDKEYHLHHWMNLSSLYLFLLFKKRRMLRSKYLNGFFVGGILQGLSYDDRFKIRRKSHPATTMKK